MIDTGKQYIARIADVQRVSIEDGPGIRTTVFFKGCNLSCAWCHNPETQADYPQLLYYGNKCTHCGACRTICPQNLKDCDVCGACVDACPNEARQISGKTYALDALFQELEKDKLFYQTSGGGVTFSGGECMLQIDFLEALLRRCKQAGLHTAVDTAGAVEFARFQRILPYTDLFLYDIKAFNDETHKKYVGVSNRLIFENLKKLLASGARVWIRIPIIGGVNDSIEEMQAINARICECGEVERIELLPYHTLGGHKYEALKIPHPIFEKPTQEQMQAFKQVFSFPTTVRG